MYDLLTYGSSEYNHLLIKMLSDEFYVLQDRVYDVMVEVYVGDEIAGFLVGNFFDEIFIIDLGYLHQEHRDKGLFCTVLGELTEVYGNIWLSLPNGFTIRSLLNNGLAVMLNDFLVQSDYPLTFKTDDGSRVNSRFYDLRISAVVDLYHNILSPVLDVDDDCFNARCCRDRVVGAEYFNEIVHIFLKRG